MSVEETMRPCVGCGYCCIKARCTFSLQFVSQERKDQQGPICPYLYLEHSRFWCRLANRFATELEIGCGCCESLNTFRAAFFQYLTGKK